MFFGQLASAEVVKPSMDEDLSFTYQTIDADEKERSVAGSANPEIKQEKPKQRVVNKSDIDKILKTIPKDFEIELEYSFSNKECEKFGIDIANKLTELNYHFTISIYGQISTNT